MGRFGKSLLYSFFVTLYFMCFYYAFGVAQTLFQGGDLVKFFFDTIIVGTVIWGFLSFLMYDLIGAFEKLNKPRDQDEKDKNDGSGPDSGSGGGKPDSTNGSNTDAGSGNGSGNGQNPNAGK